MAILLPPGSIIQEVRDYYIIHALTLALNCTAPTYLTKTGSGLPGKHNCQSMSVMNMDMKVANVSLRRCQDNG